MPSNNHVDKATEIWNSKAVALILLAISGASIWYYWRHIPAPGKAVAVLACAAGVVSVRDHRWYEKIMWCIAFAFLLRLEFLAINADREANEKQQAAFFSAQQNAFSRITADATNNFRATQTQLQAGLTKTSSALEAAKNAEELTRRNLQEITGAGAYAYVYPHAVGLYGGPTTQWEFKIHNPTDHMLMGTTVTFYGLVGGNEREGVLSQPAKPEQVGFIAPHEGRRLITHLEEPLNARLELYINSQAAGLSEAIAFRPPSTPSVTRLPEFRIELSRPVWKDPRGGDTPEGNHWKRTVKVIDWTNDYTDPEVTQGPSR